MGSDPSVPDETVSPNSMSSGRASGSSFASDSMFLLRQDPEAIVLRSEPVTLIASAKYQGKVLTSTAGGGHSFGYLNRAAFAKTDPDAPINGFGGESRFWLGPEAGPHGIFFAPGEALAGEAWDTPDAIDSEAWTLRDRGERHVSFGTTAQVRNRLGTTFYVALDRTITLEPTAASATAPTVRYRVDDRITNAGGAPWTPTTGTLCTWNLGMLPAGDDVVIVAPTIGDPAVAERAVRTTEYMGEVPAERLRFVAHERPRGRRGFTGAVLFRGDGKAITKFGLPAAVSPGIIASVNVATGAVSIYATEQAAGARHVSMAWVEGADPLDGDVVTSYNHGLADAEGGSFYELETIGPAKFLGPGESSGHVTTIEHFVGPEATVMRAVESRLGLTQEDLQQLR